MYVLNEKNTLNKIFGMLSRQKYITLLHFYSTFYVQR